MKIIIKIIANIKHSLTSLGCSQNFIKKSTGFTVLELLVTISVTVLMTSMLILYSRTGELQITLITERAKILSVITQAKSLSIQTLAEANPPCGYGVFIDVPQNQYILFKNTAPLGLGADCYQIKNGILSSYYDPTPVGNPRDVIISTSKLSTGIEFPALAVSQSILFIPPDPTVLLVPSNASGGLTITIETARATPTQASVSLNRFGQITY